MRIISRFFFACLLASFCSSLAFAMPEQQPRIKHVIYITLDGTRWQDVFLDHTHFKKFWEKYANQSKRYGEPNSDTVMEVATVPISLPSYQSMMAGSVQNCANNACGRITVETFPEKILHQLGLGRKNVVTFASWPEIAFAAEHVFNVTYVNAGNVIVVDPNTNIQDEVMKKLNQQQFVDHPSGFDRYDKYTFAQALHYFEKYQPRFIWISLDDADDAAHKGNLKRYHDALAFYDDALDALFTSLKVNNLDKDTLVIITTDHGRGNGANWIHHGTKYPESKQTWGLVINGDLQPAFYQGYLAHYSTLSIRPTVEAALGV